MTMRHLLRPPAPAPSRLGGADVHQLRGFDAREPKIAVTEPFNRPGRVGSNPQRLTAAFQTGEFDLGGLLDYPAAPLWGTGTTTPATW